MEQKNKKLTVDAVIVMLMCALLAGIACYNHLVYIQTAGTRVPIMDFWRWISMYGRDFHQGTASLKSLLTDVNEHSQALVMYIQMSILNANDFNVWSLIWPSTKIRIVLSVLFVGLILLSAYKRRNLSTYHYLGASLTIFLLLNPSQWELTIEPFSISTVIRLPIYISFFVWMGHSFIHIFEWSYKKQLIFISVASVIAVFVSIFLSGGYCAAFLGAISVAGVAMLLRNKKEIKPRHVLIGGIWAMAVVFSVIMYMMNSALSLAGYGQSITQKLINIALGTLAMIGVGIIPQEYANSHGIVPCYIAGALVLLFAAVLIWFYFKRKCDKKSLWPLMMFVYAVINALIICYSRTEAYGVIVSISSRYVVETMIGYIGLVWMLIEVLSTMECKWYHHLIALTVFAVMFGCSFWSIEVENTIAPYRQIYFQSIETLMRNIGTATPESFAVTQSSEEYVRDAVAFFQENGLSIFGQ